ncbi:hypothetical protein GDO81_004007 [Engystomops pustulosus]|uniref:Uncharacterized protein n=1 Tax=Engystomops pustulosus TaxID=76066 RepID=A0AAV6ZPK4_ENGPU|nr:hypothetical protein GDO81_004007 [Engystomops pustulosus]
MSLKLSAVALPEPLHAVASQAVTLQEHFSPPLCEITSGSRRRVKCSGSRRASCESAARRASKKLITNIRRCHSPGAWI